jgi:hypothetical protein
MPVPAPLSMSAELLSGVALTPLRIFGLNLRVWHDNQDLTTMFSDFVGTPAVIGTSVALQLDKSQGGALGSELKANGAVGLAGTATAASYNTTTGDGSVSRAANASNQSYVSWTGLGTVLFYRVTITNTGATFLSVRQGGHTATQMFAVAAGQTVTGYVISSNGTITITASSNSSTATFTVSSFVAVAGTPRYQTTSAQRPILGRHPKGGRRNLLVKAREFDNASWTKTDTTITAKAANGVDGTATMDLCTEGSATNALLAQSVTITANSTNTLAVDLKRGNHDWVCLTSFDNGSASNFIRGWFNLATGAKGSATNGGTASGATADIINLGNGIYRCILTGAINNSATAVRFATLSASADASITRVSGATRYQDRAQLESGSVTTNFQDVDTTYDCTEAGVPNCYFLQADGSDDGMVTPSLDLSSTDKVGVFAGVRKLSDAAAALSLELSPNASTNAGAFAIRAPQTAASPDFSFACGGTTLRTSTSTASFPFPFTSILTGLGDISTDYVQLRVNGVSMSAGSLDQGTGNFGNAYPIYYFRRGGSSAPFNGLEYGNFIVDTLPNATQYTQAENFENNYVGAY